MVKNQIKKLRQSGYRPASGYLCERVHVTFCVSDILTKDPSPSASGATTFNPLLSSLMARTAKFDQLGISIPRRRANFKQKQPKNQPGPIHLVLCRCRSNGCGKHTVLAFGASGATNGRYLTRKEAAAHTADDKILIAAERSQPSSSDATGKSSIDIPPTPPKRSPSDRSLAQKEHTAERARQVLARCKEAFEERKRGFGVPKRLVFLSDPALHPNAEPQLELRSADPANAPFIKYRNWLLTTHEHLDHLSTKLGSEILQSRVAIQNDLGEEVDRLDVIRTDAWHRERHRASQSPSAAANLHSTSEASTSTL